MRVHSFGARRCDDGHVPVYSKRSPPLWRWLTRCGDGPYNVDWLRWRKQTSSMGQALTTTGLRARVLVVDDEHAIAETLSLILVKSGFETAVAHDEREAVAKARSWRPDAVVSDVVMPVMDGIEAAIEILSFLPACKIALLSGKAATSDLVRHAALKGHYFEILAKQAPPAELLRELSGI